MKAAPPPEKMSEADLSKAVVYLAQLGGGWRRYHTHDSRRSSHGFPDWVLVKRDRLIFAELKSEDGKTTPDQDAWLAALDRVPGVEVYVWRPSDLQRIAHILTGKRPKLP